MSGDMSELISRKKEYRVTTGPDYRIELNWGSKRRLKAEVCLLVVSSVEEIRRHLIVETTLTRATNPKAQ
jgi:hypothetical protein